MVNNLRIFNYYVYLWFCRMGRQNRPRAPILYSSDQGFDLLSRLAASGTSDHHHSHHTYKPTTTKPPPQVTSIFSEIRWYYYLILDEIWKNKYVAQFT